MNVAALIQQVLDAGATIRVENGMLVIRPVTVVPVQTLRALKTYKPEIIRVLAAANDPTPPRPASPTIRFKLDAPVGGNTGGTVGGGDYAELIRELTDRYGKRLDLDDLRERFEERLAIAAQDAPEAVAYQTALDEIERVILQAKRKEQ